MPVYFSRDGFEVGRGFWTRRMYVRSHFDRRKRYADEAAQEKFLELTLFIRGATLSDRLRAAAADYLSARFVATVMQPHTLAAEMFRTLTGERMLASIQVAGENFAKAAPLKDEAVLYEDADFRLQQSARAGALEIVLKSHFAAFPVDADVTRKLEPMLAALDSSEFQQLPDHTSARNKVFRGFCIAASSERGAPVRQMFDTQAPEVLALMFGTMPG